MINTLPVSAQSLKKAPNPIDKHVGARVRMRRILPVEFFFDGAPSGDGTQGTNPAGGFRDSADPQYVTDFLATSEGVHLNRSFIKIQDPKIRRRIVELVDALAGNELTV